MKNKLNYAEGIWEGFDYLLKNHPEFFIIGQGLWSPWYVGSTMKDLDKIYGKDRLIDCPISEQATTGAAVGAAISGYKSLIVHPRIDFMLLAVDQIVTQAAKWRHMFGGQSDCPVTFRGIINRGGEQGAQHSQSLHSWFAHIPGLKVVMPYSAKDSRDLLIASVLSPDPVLYIDDRWLYELEEDYSEIEILDLDQVKPKKLMSGDDITIVGLGYSTSLAVEGAKNLENRINRSADVFDLRIINPLNCEDIISSVKKTGRLLVIDGDWKTAGMAGEIISRVTEEVDISLLKTNPKRICLPDAPAPTSKVLEEIYYPDINLVNEVLFKLFEK